VPHAASRKSNIWKAAQINFSAQFFAIIVKPVVTSYNVVAIKTFNRKLRKVAVKFHMLSKLKIFKVGRINLEGTRRNLRRE